MKVKRDLEWQKQIGKRLEIGLKVLGRRQADVARFLGMSPQRLNNYVKGTRPLDMELAVQICDEYGLTLDYLYRGESRTLPFDLHNEVQRFMGRPGTIKH